LSTTKANNADRALKSALSRTLAANGLKDGAAALSPVLAAARRAAAPMVGRAMTESVFKTRDFSL